MLRFLGRNARVNHLVAIVFALVYAGMMAGGIPGMALDRTGVALLGALVLIATARISLEDAWQALDVPTMALLFGLMVVSAQFRLGGFYTRFAQRLAAIPLPPAALLGAVLAGAGALSALLCNDIICLAMTPLLAVGCARRGLDPVPFLLGLACAANIGSAATLIGNPQNMLIGQVLGLRFDVYLLQAAVPALLGLLATWWILVLRFRGRWHLTRVLPAVEVRPFNRWQTTKGFLVLGALVIAFLLGYWPRDMVALAAAGLLLASRKMASRSMLQLVDWQLLVLFAGLFIVNRALLLSSRLDHLAGGLRAAGVDLSQPAWLFGASVVLSNLVSNVPATMLLLPFATHPLAGPLLALSSTLAGNLIVVGSIANIIVIDQAAQVGVKISWREHARVGVPVTAATLAIAALWLALLAAFG